jgi:hypothetical protein
MARYEQSPAVLGLRGHILGDWRTRAYRPVFHRGSTATASKESEGIVNCKPLEQLKREILEASKLYDPEDEELGLYPEPFDPKAEIHAGDPFRNWSP